MSRKIVKFAPPYKFLIIGILCFVGPILMIMKSQSEIKLDSLPIPVLFFSGTGLALIGAFIYRIVKPIIIQVELRDHIIVAECENFDDANFEFDIENVTALFIEKTIIRERDSEGKLSNRTIFDLVAEHKNGETYILLDNRAHGNLKKLSLAIKQVAKMAGKQIRVGQRTRRAGHLDLSDMIDTGVEIFKQIKKNKK